MTHRKTTALSRGIETLTVVAGAAVVLWLASVVLVQTAYPMWPVQPSAAALRLDQEAGQRSLSFENGQRYAGLPAPVGMDPLSFGRCAYPDVEDRARQVLAGKDLSASSRAERHALVTRCLQGQALLELPKPGPNDWASPSWTQDHWLNLARSVPEPVLMERADAVWRHGPVRLGIDFDRPGTDPAPLLWLTQWRMASAVGLWRDGHRDEALRTWATSAEHALLVAGDDLAETMRATTTLTRWLLSLQTAVRSGDGLDDFSAAQAKEWVSRVDTLPNAVHRSLISEWQAMVHTLRRTDDSVRSKWQAKREESPELQASWLYLLSFFGLIYDPVDSVNLMATHFEDQRAAMLAAAKALQPEPVAPPVVCAWLGPFWHVCRPHERNPFGRWLVRQPADHILYGTRVADLRNLAAATRLTIEARRQGLHGEALARFVAQAPEDMRDVFTGQPFPYNRQTRELTIVLREKSPVLGDAGEYRLPL
jgi:hypothetical protein